ncbi:MAG TPA: DUF3040 domain-containing protein, partial [Thermomonospora sp.]|nr:DUF3040 domain-containing protein [Thermomonospora sp.]
MTSGANVDPEKTFTALRPRALDDLAEEAHLRRRDHDLAQAMAMTPERRRPRRRPVLVLAGVAAGAVVAAGGVVVGTGGDPAAPAPGASRP